MSQTRLFTKTTNFEDKQSEKYGYHYTLTFENSHDHSEKILLRLYFDEKISFIIQLNDEQKLSKIYEACKPKNMSLLNYKGSLHLQGEAILLFKKEVNYQAIEDCDRFIKAMEEAGDLINDQVKMELQTVINEILKKAEAIKQLTLKTPYPVQRGFIFNSSRQIKSCAFYPLDQYCSYIKQALEESNLFHFTDRDEHPLLLKQIDNPKSRFQIALSFWKSKIKMNENENNFVPSIGSVNPLIT